MSTSRNRYNVSITTISYSAPVEPISNYFITNVTPHSPKVKG